MLDLILPLDCGGCGAPSTRWCAACAAELVVRPDEPHVVTPRIDPLAPVFALGRYAGARRRAILACKEHGRGDLVAPLARVLAVGIHRLLAWGMVETPLTLVPAPTRRSARYSTTPSPTARADRPDHRLGPRAAGASRGDTGPAAAQKAQSRKPRFSKRPD